MGDLKMNFEGCYDPSEPQYQETREPPCEHIAALLALIDEQRLGIMSGCGCCNGLHIDCEQCDIHIHQAAIWRSDDEEGTQ